MPLLFKRIKIDFNNTFLSLVVKSIQRLFALFHTSYILSRPHAKRNPYMNLPTSQRQADKSESIKHSTKNSHTGPRPKCDWRMAVASSLCVGFFGLREQHEIDFFTRTHMIIINSIYLTAHDVSRIGGLDGIGGIGGIGGLSRDNSVIVHRYLPRPSLRRSIKLCWAMMASAATSAQSKDNCVLYVKLLTTEYFIYVAGACDSDRFRITLLGDNNNKLQGYQHIALSETT